MITGDNALTACHVAGELGFCSDKTALMFEPERQIWQSVHGSEQVPTEDLLRRKVTPDLCLTGPGLDWMMRSHFAYLSSVLPK